MAVATSAITKTHFNTSAKPAMNDVLAGQMLSFSETRAGVKLCGYRKGHAQMCESPSLGGNFAQTHMVMMFAFVP